MDDFKMKWLLRRVGNKYGYRDVPYFTAFQVETFNERFETKQPHLVALKPRQMRMSRK